MKTNGFRKILLGLTLLLGILQLEALRAQYLPITLTSSAGPGVLYEDQNGLFVVNGTFGLGSLSSPTPPSNVVVSGVGTRMMWYPAKAAFRAGILETGYEGYWNDANIGNGSVSFGRDTGAAGVGSVAMGEYSVAYGEDSLAIGEYAQTNGLGSVAFGQSTNATGQWSMAIGLGTTSSSYASLASGYQTNASGYVSTTMGFGTSAASWCDVAIGQFNVGGGTAASWVATDPAFEIGNGTSATAPSDAFVVYKNGNVAAHGTMRCAQGGDISMGGFTAGNAP
jgi:hypothetical protein